MDNHQQQREEQPYLLHDHLLHHHWPPLQGQQQQPLQHQHPLYLLNDQQQPVQQGIILHENSQNFLDSMPRGYRFCPTDEELIVHYLRKRIAKAPLPLNRIHEANVYGHNPQELTNRYRSDSLHNVNGWYFFTYLTNKYPKGSRPSRSCGDGGFWKPTGKDKKIYYNGNTVGYRKSLDFLLGPGEKTAWKMHEYRIHANNPKSDPVLCRLYMNIRRKKKDESEGDTVELMRENLDQCFTVNEAPMQNEDNDLAVGNISSAGSTNNQCMEYITSTLDTGGDANSNQVIYDLSSFQFPDHPFQDFQGYTNSHGGLEAITQEFTEPFHLSKGTMMPSNLSTEPFHLSRGTMIPSDLNMEDVSKYAIGGTDLSDLAWQNGCAGGYVNMTSLQIDGENSGYK
ncbi:NAC domain-containing protein 16-like [Coffea eugenioides]|uniref:NAC domain-containing protein 16-like n=1 Tax=Coffea eugenioides TaxID=49369 RepID=UPI000F613784|nr:NAC domain-containing protein 16-like [Coffea eugenioides]